jgi:SulP family sulfate permease
VLGAIIIVACAGLIKWKEFLQLWRLKRSDAFAMAVAVLVTLALGVEIGLGAAVAVSLLIVIYQTSKPYSAVLGRIEGTSATWRNVKRFPTLAHEVPRALVFRWDASLYFANCDAFQETVYELLDERSTPVLSDSALAAMSRAASSHSGNVDAVDEEAQQPTETAEQAQRIKAIVFDFSSVNDMDTTALHALEALIEHMNVKRDVTVCLASVKGPVRDLFLRAHIAQTEEQQAALVHTTIERALLYLSEKGIIPKENRTLKKLNFLKLVVHMLY